MENDHAEADGTMDMPAHEKSYKNFTGFVKFGIPVVVIVFSGMAIFLT
jgi:hypothetical protein